MEIIKAEPTGICFGVERALKEAERVLDEKTQNEKLQAERLQAEKLQNEKTQNEKTQDEKEVNKAEKSNGTCHKKIYMFGDLIHNKRVIKSLQEKGIENISDITEAEEGSTVILRCHGIPAKYYDMAEKQGIDIVDTTCPFVKKIHKLVRRAKDEGKNILIAGDSSHPEVVGINGWCDDSAVIIGDVSEAKEYLAEKQMAGEGENSFFAVAQTTLRREVFCEIMNVLEKGGMKLEINDTICNATKERQDSCRELAEKSDAMLIIGDKKSSNTKKLYDIAVKRCPNSFFIENIEDLPLKQLELCNKIGVAAGASTPECIIKEVTANMSENITNNTEELSMQDFMEDIEKSLRLPRSGEIVTGKIHEVNDNEIIVNLGCKKDGIIPLSEITLEEGKTLTDLYSEGDEITAKVAKTDDGDGSILLSKKKLEVSEHWDEIIKAYEEKEIIDVKVIRVVNGGVIALYKEVSGFIPLSQLSDKFVEDPSEFVGQTLDVRVSRVDKNRGKAVFSHKMVLYAEKEKRIAEIWNSIHIDDVVKGVVMRFTDYGAFVDIGGIDGLLHISEISWGKLKHPQEVLSIGEEINVKILAMNEEKGKISLGLKQNQPEPWSVINDNYEVGQVVEGKIVQIKEYGAFVELEPGLDGLVHISEVAHKRVANIEDELEIGQKINTKILDIDSDRKRISLSIKETIEFDPNEAADEIAEEAVSEEAVEAAPAEETVEEAPVAEAPAEEAPVEETPAEEATVEETEEA